jgi:hypothetical protein
MAQLHNNKLDRFLEQQYDAVEEEFTLFPIPSSGPAPEASITPEDTFSPSTKSDYDDVQREVGRVFGVLGHHISKLHNIKSAKKPANAKYKALKAAIKDLVAEAEKHGIKLDIQASTTTALQEPEEEVVIDETEE